MKRFQITQHHPEADTGLPVFVDLYTGEILPQHTGLKFWRQCRELHRKQIGIVAGSSHRSVEQWESGRRGVPPLLPLQLLQLQRQAEGEDFYLMKTKDPTLRIKVPEYDIRPMAPEGK